MKNNKLLWASPRLWLGFFLFLFIGMAFLQGQDMLSLFADFINRIGMNGVLVLAMVPAICCGIGPNFGISIGILCGLLSGCISVEGNLQGLAGFFTASILAVVLSLPAGYWYGRLLNRLKGAEMTVSTYVGFAAVSLMSIGWTVFPFQSPDMIWAIGGKGLRTTIPLTDYFENSLNQLFSITIRGKVFSLGAMFFFFLLCFFLWVFLKTKEGTAMITAGKNPCFAAVNGIDVNKQRILGTMLSMALGAVGILVYSQSYGFMQLYQAPLMMPFPAVGAILMGGAAISRAKVSHAVIGVIIFQLFMAVVTPVVNSTLADSTISDAIRVVVSYSVILYALTRK